VDGRDDRSSMNEPCFDENGDESISCCILDCVTELVLSSTYVCSIEVEVAVLFKFCSCDCSVSPTPE
jgi:hypothetical protein